MCVGKYRKNFTCKLGDDVLRQVTEAKYLGCIFTDDGKLDRETELQESLKMTLTLSNSNSESHSV